MNSKSLWFHTSVDFSIPNLPNYRAFFSSFVDFKITTEVSTELMPNARAHLMKLSPAMRLTVQVRMESSMLLLQFSNWLRNCQQILIVFIFQSTAVGANGVRGSPAAKLVVEEFSIGEEQNLKWQNMEACHARAYLMKLISAMKLVVQVGVI